MDEIMRDQLVHMMGDIPWYQWKWIRQTIDRAYEKRAGKVTLPDSASLKKDLIAVLNYDRRPE